MSQTQKILNLDQKITYPVANQEGTAAIASMVKTLIQQKQVEIGINSTNKALIENKAKMIVVTSCINPPSLIDHLLFLCSKKKIPIIVSSMDPKSFGKEVGMKMLTAVALKDTVDQNVINLLMPFTQMIPSSNFPSFFV